MSIKITLDPGHGQYTNSSPLNASFYEGKNNFFMAEYLKEALLGYEGVEVELTRGGIAEDPSLEERGKMAAGNGSTLFYSIHSNAFSDPSAYGVTGFYSVKTPEAKQLCEMLCAATAALLPGSKVRRVITKTLSGGRDYYGVLRASDGVCYSMLIEHGFHTNPDELEAISGDEWKRRWANATAAVIAEFFGLAPKASEDNDEEYDGEAEKEIIREELIGIAQRIIALSELI